MQVPCFLLIVVLVCLVASVGYLVLEEDTGREVLLETLARYD